MADYYQRMNEYKFNQFVKGWNALPQVKKDEILAKIYADKAAKGRVLQHHM